MTDSVGCLSKCGGIARTRGLCFRCYRRAGDLVRGGWATWKELEEQGKCLPALSKQVLVGKAKRS